MIIEWANIKVNVISLAIGIVFLSFAILYFRLAITSRQKVSLKNIEIAKLDEEAVTPKQAIMEITNTGVRSTALKLFASQLNKVTKEFEQHLNQDILPKIKDHINEIYRTSSRGFRTAGILAIVSTILAFLSAFLIL